jgi:hypothetical protein
VIGDMPPPPELEELCGPRGQFCIPLRTSIEPISLSPSFAKVGIGVIGPRKGSQKMSS